MALCAMLVLAQACAPRRNVPEAAHAGEALLQQAVEAQRTARYPEAIRLYRELLRGNPANALAHFELAVLLQDNQQDEAGAIYHYRNYLDLRPDSDKAPLARQRIAEAEEKLARRFSGRSGDSARVVSDMQIVARIEELNSQVAERDRTIRQLGDQLALANKDNERLAKDIRSYKERIEVMLDGTGSAPKPPSRALTTRSLDAEPATSRANPPSASSPRQPRSSDKTYRVKRNDSLWSIAQKVYGDSDRHVDIRNANRDRIGPNGRLNEGDELIIPFP